MLNDKQQIDLSSNSWDPRTCSVCRDTEFQILKTFYVSLSKQFSMKYTFKNHRNDSIRSCSHHQNYLYLYCSQAQIVTIGSEAININWTVQQDVLEEIHQQVVIHNSVKGQN